MLHIQKLQGGLDEERDDEMDGNDGEKAGEQDEFILQISDPNRDSYNFGYLNREIGMDL